MSQFIHFNSKTSITSRLHKNLQFISLIAKRNAHYDSIKFQTITINSTAIISFHSKDQEKTMREEDKKVERGSEVRMLFIKIHIKNSDVETIRAITHLEKEL